jgi:hypothetical protein
LYCWLLPLLWAAGCWYGWQHPGDDYLLWLMGSIGGAWIALVEPGIGESTEILYPTLLAGSVVMLLAGAVLDLLRVSFLAFLAALLLAGISVAGFTISRFPTYESALAKNGSLVAYLIFGGMIGLYLAVAVTVPARILSLIVLRLRHGRSGERKQDLKLRLDQL